MDFLYEFEGLGEKRSNSFKSRGWNRDSDGNKITLKVTISTKSMVKPNVGDYTIHCLP